MNSELREFEEELNNSVPIDPDDEVTEEELNSSVPVNPDAEETKEELVSSTRSFRGLFKVLQAIGDVEGSSKTYSPGELITLIDRVRHQNLDPRYITRTYGLRKKVIELLAAESN